MAATIEVQELRGECTRRGIPYHPRHSANTLRDLLKENDVQQDESAVEDSPSEPEDSDAGGEASAAPTPISAEPSAEPAEPAAPEGPIAPDGKIEWQPGSDQLPTGIDGDLQLMMRKYDHFGAKRFASYMIQLNEAAKK